MQETWAVLSDDLNQRAARGARVVELNLGFHFDLSEAWLFSAEAFAEHAIEIGFVEQNGDDAALETFPFGQVQLESAKAVREIKGVHHSPGLVREGVGFDDVLAPRGKYSGDTGEQVGAVVGDESEFEPVAAAFEQELHGILPETSCHFDMGEYVVGGIGRKVALGKTFEEVSEFAA